MIEGAKMSMGERIREYLAASGVRYRIHTHAHTGTTLESAYAAHVSPKLIAKAVLLRDAAGAVLAVLPSDERLSVERVNAALGRSCTLAGQDDLAEVFADCAVGAVPALGVAYGIPTVLDRSLTGLDTVYFEAGDHKSLVEMAGLEFERLIEPVHVLAIEEPVN
ncbi:MAG: aminoacyl-tRNA deacylase [Thiotrichales bacterium]